MARGPAGEGAQVQVAAHPRAVVDRIVVPEERLAAHLLGDAGEVAGRELARADLLAGPHQLDGRVEAGAQVLQVVRRALAEHAVEDRIVGVVAGADDQAAGASVRPAIQSTISTWRAASSGRSPFMSSKKIAEVGEAEAVQLGELGGQRRPSRGRRSPGTAHRG